VFAGIIFDGYELAKVQILSSALFDSGEWMGEMLVFSIIIFVSQ